LIQGKKTAKNLLEKTGLNLPRQTPEAPYTLEHATAATEKGLFQLANTVRFRVNARLGMGAAIRRKTKHVRTELRCEKCRPAGTVICASLSQAMMRGGLQIRRVEAKKSRSVVTIKRQAWTQKWTPEEQTNHC